MSGESRLRLRWGPVLYVQADRAQAADFEQCRLYAKRVDRGAYEAQINGNKLPGTFAALVEAQAAAEAAFFAFDRIEDARAAFPPPSRRG